MLKIVSTCGLIHLVFIGFFVSLWYIMSTFYCIFSYFYHFFNNESIVMIVVIWHISKTYTEHPMKYL